MCSREELRGIPRAGNAKDIDWSKVANSLPDKVDKPAPIKISVNELLNRVKPQRKQTTALQTAETPALVDSNSKSLAETNIIITGVPRREKVTAIISTHWCSRTKDAVCASV